ncbi:MAG: Uma2 family endonuclease [Anaerolineae bacterium]|nr:Uma2 family endonuclease [Anaerolineae bacterium]
MTLSTTRQTVEQFLAWSHGQDRLFELIDGEVHEKMASFTPSKIALRIGRFIGNYLDEHPIGEVTGADGTYLMSPTDAYMPDVGYIAKTRIPETLEGVMPVPPDLAEVKSPSDSYRELRRKAEKYIAFGTSIVWLVFPEKHMIEVYIGTTEEQILTLNDTLTGGDLLPGFTLPLGQIFQ